MQRIGSEVGVEPLQRERARREVGWVLHGVNQKCFINGSANFEVRNFKLAIWLVFPYSGIGNRFIVMLEIVTCL